MFVCKMSNSVKILCIIFLLFVCGVFIHSGYTIYKLNTVIDTYRDHVTEIHDHYKQELSSYKKLAEAKIGDIRIVSEESRRLIGKSMAFQNKNLLNVKNSWGGNKWKGQIGTDRFGHAIFSDWEYGIRAASIVLKNYANKHEIDTVQKIVKRFCTGNHQTYIKFISKKLNVSPDEKIDILKRMPELLKAMARFESGQDIPDRFFVPYDVVTYLNTK